jgi:hypothetical protein
MEEHEAAQRAAEHRAAALFSLGWENGAGAGIWARTVLDELGRHEAARERYASDSTDRQAYERLCGSALMLVVAIDQVLAFEKRVRSITGDAELARARERFDRTGPQAETIRDIAAHLDAYAVGEGDRQTETGRGRPAQPPVTESNVTPFIFWTNGGGTRLQLADEELNLRTAAHAAVALAEVVERVRLKYLQRVEREANAALRRRYGLDQ